MTPLSHIPFPHDQSVERSIIVADRPAGFFEGTEMPTAGWWEALWPAPRDVLSHGLGQGLPTTSWEGFVDLRQIESMHRGL